MADPGCVTESSRQGAEIAPHVLVVDDEPLMRWSVAETLRADGCAVREAVDGGQAVQAAADASWPIDVVLLDYHLPDTSDLELLTAMRCLLPQSDLILMTADESSDLVSRACALGASGVLRKPFNMAELAPFADAHRDRGRSH